MHVYRFLGSSFFVGASTWMMSLQMASTDILLEQWRIQRKKSEGMLV